MAKETSPNSSPPATAETELSGHNDSMSSTSASDPYSVSELEAKWYYAGLPSSPRLVYRTGSTPWTAPSGLEAFRVLKELRPVFGHKINTVWEEHLANKVIGCLNSVNVEWTSIDIVRFAVVGEAPGPVVLWIGVVPASLSGTDALGLGSQPP
ncbi:hypothetical protein EVG20_g7095 [Dentipellis fragilis]|uniref:Uncharacterized protein n=1 Tax=Dentipellis fragilis TaxID=205917 RepID=A0A4Y9YFJ8_9AGAM|nr:hypothetical protein EVG20_g7095 [Dentipellis fragilis]